MKKTRLLMGMHITVEIVDPLIGSKPFEKVFSYFEYIDNKFSTYKENSEISKYNKGLISDKDFSNDMKEVFRLSEQTKIDTNGYFDIFHKGFYDPSGLVKGWSILGAATIMKDMGYKNFYVDAGGDIQFYGKNVNGENWVVGIKNPFNQKENIKILSVHNEGVATSGIYIRGQHIYNPIDGKETDGGIVSMTVIGPNIYDADRYATAAFAMGKNGIGFISGLEGLEGYMIDKKGTAIYTNGFERYIK